MKITVIGDGSFGGFLKELLPNAGFEIVDDANTVILAVPISAYDELGAKFKDKHLINVCSVQKPSTDILLKHTGHVTSLHPLFGRRTPIDKRNTIITYCCLLGEEAKFIYDFSKISGIVSFPLFTPKSHDELMLKTHVAAVKMAEFCKPFIDAAAGVSDELIPNSFRLFRQAVKTLEDMPKGTMQSIMANPYIK